MELSDLARVCRSILYVLMKPMSSNMLRMHCRHTQRDQLHQFPRRVSNLSLCCPSSSLFLLTSGPYHGCGVIRQGTGRVRELSVAGVDLRHWFDPCHQQLRHLFLWNLQHTHTESYGVNNMDSVSKCDVCESEWDVQIWFLPSYGTSSFHWPGGTWTELHGLSCRAETRETNTVLQ